MAHRIQLILPLALAACGIGVVGIDPIEGADGSAPATDAGTAETGAKDGASTPPPPPADCSKSDCAALALVAPGFTPIGFGAATDVCPDGFDVSEGSGEPTAKSGSCACGPCTTTGSTCDTGSVPSSQSNDSSCNNYGDPFSASGGVCKTFSNYWGSTYGGVGAPAAVVGTCHADGQVVREKIDATQHRVCTPRPDTCPAAMCSLGGTLEVCLVAPGDVACPAAAPVKTLIGDLQATCDACGCTPAATCSGKLHWWEVSTSCSGPESGTVPSNVCTKVNGKNIRSVRWEGIPTETCSATAPAAQAKVTRAALKTVCCPG